MNYYDVLKVKKNSTQTEIKSAYKSLVKKYHPDIFNGDKSVAEFKTKEINIAYDVLSNPELRAEYDLSIEPPKIEPEPIRDYTDSYTYTKRTNNRYKTYDTQPRTNPIEEYHDNFTENISRQIEKLNANSKLILFLIFILGYILFFLMSFLQLQSIFNNNINTSENSKNTVNIDNTLNITDNVPYTTTPFENYFNEIELKEYYNTLKDETAFESYEDFKTYLENYFSEYFETDNY